ncbi:MAG: hypothetical protein ACREFX_12195 [Opitutaceae bacterium]
MRRVCAMVGIQNVSARVRKYRRPFSSNVTRFQRAGLALCLFCAVLGCRWALIHRDGMDLPEWDQWDAEGLYLLRPWKAHSLTLSLLWKPHNEHRVVLTKLEALGLAAADRQWDQRLEAAANAFLAALIALSLWLYGAERISAFGWQIFWLLLMAAAYAGPDSWENVVRGFDSQQLYLVLLSLGAICWLLPRRASSLIWWLGAACAVLDLGTMASGFFAALIVAGLIGFELVRKRRSVSGAVPSLIVSLLVVAVGVVTQHVVPGHRLLIARGVSDFVMTVVQALGWPAYRIMGLFSLALWAPWTVATVRYLRGRWRADSATVAVLVGLGGWAILQIFAAGYARGAGGLPPPRRYLDNSIFGLAINGLCLALLAESLPARRSAVRRRAFAAAGALWGALLLGGGCHDWFKVAATKEITSDQTYHYYCVENIRRYLATGDAGYLRHREEPYPTFPALRFRVDQPILKNLLPVSVRAPLPLRRASGDGGFRRFASFHAQAAKPRLPPAPGISAKTPPLDNRVWWGSYGSAARPAVWRSGPLSDAVGGWLRFYLAGRPAAPGASLEIRDAATGRLWRTVKPDRTPGDTWRAAYVPAPPGAFIVVAREAAPSRWFAFSEPSEMGRWSYWAWRAVRRGALLAELAAGAAVLIVLAGTLPRRRAKNPAS